MLRNLLAQLFRRRAPSGAPPLRLARQGRADGIVFIANMEAPVRVGPDARLRSDVASVRLRGFLAASRLAASRPVYLLPPDLLADQPDHEALASAGAVVVTKFSTSELLARPQRFERMLAWLTGARGRVRLIADLTDNYAALGDAEGQPFLERYQRGLGECCTLTVPCAALLEDLQAYARHGIHLIEDPYESPRALAPRGVAGTPVGLCWFGQLGARNLDSVVRGLVQAANGLGGRAAELRLVTHETRRDLAAEVARRLAQAHPAVGTTFVPWSLEATWRAIEASDLVILPQDHDDRWGRVKSHNRLVESIRCGRLAIASPIPSYLELADYACVGEDLGRGVQWALANPGAALERLGAGQAHVARRFAPGRIADAWAALLADDAAAGPPSADPETPLRLNLGCGDKILAGYVNVDVAESRAGRRPDVLCDLRALTPFAAASVDEVLAVHVVEHFWRWEVVAVLREWVRVLKPGGKMILECPNLLSACEELLKDPAGAAGPGREGQRTMWVFYGDPAWKDPLMCHRWNYTPQSLAAVMAEAGLVEIRQEPAQFKLRDPRDMRVVGVAPHR